VVQAIYQMLLGMLSGQQRRIKELLYLGLTNAEIARRLGMSEPGVKYHVTEIMNKLGVSNRHEAGAYPEERPWWAAGFAPVAMIWRKATAALPFKASSVAMVVSAAGFAAAAGGLALLAILLVGTGGDGPPALLAAGDGPPALVVAAEATPGDGPPVPPTPTANPPSRAPLPVAPVLVTAPPYEQAEAPPSETPAPPVTPTPTVETPWPPQLTAVATGYDYTCVVSDLGGVWCWGQNDSGQLGDGTTVDKLTPARVVGLDNAVSVAAGAGHTCAVTEDGDVSCWGAGYGLTPVAIVGLSDVTAIAAGASHTCALTNGDALCWSGQEPPMRVEGLNDVTAIAVGAAQACARTGQGSAAQLWCWGSNAYGVLTNGMAGGSSSTPVRSLAPDGVRAVAVGEWTTCVLEAGGTVDCWGVVPGQNGGECDFWGGPNQESCGAPTTTSGLPSDGTSLVAGSAQEAAPACLLTEAGSVWCWELAICWFPCAGPQLMLEDGVTAIAAGGNHVCAVTDAGEVSCWGSNGGGQLGIGEISVSGGPVSPLWLETPTAGYPEGQMAVDCDALAKGVQGHCGYNVGDAFHVQVHVTVVPRYVSYDGLVEGYQNGFNTRLSWSDAQLDYLDTLDPADEARWPDCDIALRDESAASLLSACVPMLALTPGSTFTGAVFEFKFECREAGTASIELVGGLETFFLDANANSIYPNVTGSTIVCAPPLV